jgi:hypothetical protein
MLTYGGQIKLFETSLQDLINIPETFPIDDIEPFELSALCTIGTSM